MKCTDLKCYSSMNCDKCIQLYNPTLSDTEHFHPSQKLPSLSVPTVPTPIQRPPLFGFFHRDCFAWSRMLCKWIRSYEFLCLVSLVSVVVLRFHHVVVGIRSSFLLLSSIHCAHRTTLCLSSLLSSDSWVVSVFWLLCLSTCVEIFLWISVFIVPG